jgi:Pyruvate/2-oxoacid:ferredoxin oxidoreductase delta subunit
MKFYSDEQVQRITNELENAVTIPVNMEIQAEHRVYSFPEMREILGKANRIVLQDCGCKTKYGNCDAPREVCIGLDEEAEEMLSQDLNHAKQIDIDEAISVLQKSHKAGLVHLAYTMKGKKYPNLICSCCPCCCHTLGSLVRNGIHTKILTSKYIAVHDTNKCITCGKCVERCVFQARSIREGSIIHDQAKCFGCGLCVSTCPAEAIDLVPRKT